MIGRHTWSSFRSLLRRLIKADAAGTAFPTDYLWEGRLFYRSDLNQVYAYDGSDWQLVGSQGVGLRPGHASGFQYGPANQIATVTTSAFANTAQMEYVQYPVGGPRPVTFSAITCEVFSTGSGSVRLGVYDSGSDGRPNNLLEESGALTVGVVGKRQYSFSGGGLELAPGNYWTACQTDDGTATFYRLSGDGLAMSIGFPTSASLSTGRRRLWREAHTFGAFPSTAGTLIAQNAQHVLVTMEP